jgi:hypothetical protein
MTTPHLPIIVKLRYHDLPNSNGCTPMSVGNKRSSNSPLPRHVLLRKESAIAQSRMSRQRRKESSKRIKKLSLSC